MDSFHGLFQLYTVKGIIPQIITTKLQIFVPG